jgi:hypothetical protein
MTYKQTVIEHKTLSSSGAGFPLAGLLAKLRNVVKINVPVGYQDESGFHTGVKRSEKQAQWPAHW